MEYAVRVKSKDQRTRRRIIARVRPPGLKARVAREMRRRLSVSIAELVAIAGMGVRLVRIRRAPHTQHMNLAGVAAQDFEREVVDAHFLAAMRHAPEPMRDEAADG